MKADLIIRFAGMLACAGILQIPAAAAAERVLYSFQGTANEDTFAPYAGLTNVKGVLYGTTFEGGQGTVFSVTRGGAERVVYRFNFHDENDGEGPTAGLINVKGTLYGTTLQGGNSDCNSAGCGTVFSVDTSGTEKVLYAFKASDGDGANPRAGLIKVRGKLYGTTSRGLGTVFSITPDGKEKVLYAFKAGSDGAAPYAGLINVNGALYGTTTTGGSGGSGTVYSITPGGTENVVYAFKGGNDGAYPVAGLIDVDGTLYGTTEHGGGTGCFSTGCGTVFSIAPDGTEKVLYAFQGGSDGFYPEAGLIDVKGRLYGTTLVGGGTGCFNETGCGTVFSITPSGAEKVLYAFQGGDDGAHPQAGLIYLKHNLYGTTSDGGTGTDTCQISPPGCGTVFAVHIKP